MDEKGTEEYLSEWETLIESIDKTEIPIRFVNRIIFNSVNSENNKNLNRLDLDELREKGFPDDIIQEIIDEVVKDMDNYTGTMDFLLNIAEVARVAQHETDQYLNKR